ncbi:MAG: hypothetical protein HWE13_00850 [Gammaproteobacteria bacterium]|nr:hypothetical protein [Gammaproteobacteria bacterium]NVK86636.1 hypothetical protein [Gammaproteobacteria bacterium]
MRKKPDILVVLAAVLGLGIVVSSVGTSDAITDDKSTKVAQSKQQESQVAGVNQ